MQHIKAIETHYGGCRFRSRLEARFAIFFDALGIKWEYEPEGFETSAGRYLPDFQIYPGQPHGGPTWFEVKRERAPDDPRHRAFVEGSQIPLVIAKGIPRSAADQQAHLVRMWPGTERVSPVAFQWIGDRKTSPVPTLTGGPRRSCPPIDAAYTAARSARFEHGEVG